MTPTGSLLSLEAKKEIEEVVLRYCRGIYRADRELLGSCYHPGGIEEHGSNHTGDAAGFIDWLPPSSIGSFTVARRRGGLELVLVRHAVGALRQSGRRPRSG